MIRLLWRLMRPGDWIKNVFVLLAPLFAVPTMSLRSSVPAAQRLDPLVVAEAGLTAFAAFCLLSSGFYAVNDVIDAERDRAHPVKRLRPVASGALRPDIAWMFGAALIALGLGLGFAVNAALGITLLLYALLQAAYNVRLKRVMLVDVVTVAIGFALRATAGAVAIQTKISVWLVLCVFFLCLYLGFIKRLCDMASAERDGKTKWRSPAGYDNRIELNWLLGVSAVLAIMTYLTYSVSSHAISIFGPKASGFALLSPLVLVAVHRFYRRASAGLSDSPLDALRQDRAVLASVALFATGTLALLYVPAVQTVIENLFLVTDGKAAP